MVRRILIGAVASFAMLSPAAHALTDAQVRDQASWYLLDVTLTLLMGFDEGATITDATARTHGCRRTQRRRGSCLVEAKSPSQRVGCEGTVVVVQRGKLLVTRLRGEVCWTY